jgi:hypothetical protein
LLQKIHSSAATSKIIPFPSWQIASEETKADSSNMLCQSTHHLSLKSDTPYITKTKQPTGQFSNLVISISCFTTHPEKVLVSANLLSALLA